MNFKNFALIGCGYWGTIVTNCIKKLGLFKYIYIYDLNQARVRLFKKKFKNFVVYKKINEISYDNEIKYIYLATPPNQNYKLIKNFIKYNKKILVEKPGLIKIIEFENIKKLLKDSKSNLFFGYIYLHNKYIHYLKKLIDNKEKFGEVKYIKFVRQNFGPVRKDVNSFMDLGSHDIGIAKYLLSQKIKIVNHVKQNLLKKKHADIVFASFKTNKVNFDISVSWLTPEKIRKIIIITTKKMILFDEINNHSPIQIYNNYARYPKIDYFTKKYFGKKRYNLNQPLIHKGNVKKLRFNFSSPLENEILSFIKEKKNLTDISLAMEIFKISKF